MEIKTCEQYVLDKLQQAETRIAELEIENAHLTDKLLDLTRTVKPQKQAKPANEPRGDLMSVTECAELFADFLGDCCCCNYNDISFDTRICWLDCDQAEDNGCNNGLGCWKRYVRTALGDLRGETELPDDLDDDLDPDPSASDAPNTSSALGPGYKPWRNRHQSGDADIQLDYDGDDAAYKMIMDQTAADVENEYNAAFDKLNAAISAIDSWCCNGEFGDEEDDPEEDDQDDARR